MKRLFVALLLFTAVPALPVLAQEVPAWAAPADTPDETPPSDPEDRGPDLPDDPNPVPLGSAGGLALLALAGAGVAARRLRPTPSV